MKDGWQRFEVYAPLVRHLIVRGDPKYQKMITHFFLWRTGWAPPLPNLLSFVVYFGGARPQYDKLPWITEFLPPSLDEFHLITGIF
jgi:hypothetical protein